MHNYFGIIYRLGERINLNEFFCSPVHNFFPPPLFFISFSFSFSLPWNTMGQFHFNLPFAFGIHRIIGLFSPVCRFSKLSFKVERDLRVSRFCKLSGLSYLVSMTGISFSFTFQYNAHILNTHGYFESLLSY